MFVQVALSLLAASPWWVGIDKNVDALIEQAAQQSPDVSAQRAAAAAAASVRDAATAPLFPQLSFDLSGRVLPQKGVGFNFGLPGRPGDDENTALFYTGDAMFNARWQNNPGATYFQRRAAGGDLLAARAQKDIVIDQIALQVATAYFDLGLATEQLRLLEAQKRTTLAMTELVELRAQSGQATALDLLNQKSQLASFSARLPAVVAKQKQAQAALRLLAGAAPTNVALAHLTAFVRGRPDLEKRADIRAAKARTFAAEQRATAAWFGLFPSIGVSANAGWQARLTDDVTTQFNWGASAFLSLPLFTGFAKSSAVASADARSRSARAQLAIQMRNRQQALEFAEALDDALLLQSREEAKQVQALQQTFDESRRRYSDGLIDYTQVLLAQNALFAAERIRLQTHRQMLGARLALQEAARIPNE